MTLTTDERRALTFIALLVFLSAALRLAAAPDPVPLPEGGGPGLASHIEATRAAVAAEERLATPLGEGERIDPNAATAAELQRLPRVGPALAGRIVEDRERRGRFLSLEELGRVPGIGERTLERLAPHLSLRPGGGGRAGGIVRAGVGAAGTGGGARGGRDGGAVVDLNAADAAALATLPGIGPVLAERVVAYRDSAGGFGTVDDLTRVPGIGPATLGRIRERVRVYR